MLAQLCVSLVAEEQADCLELACGKIRQVKRLIFAFRDQIMIKMRAKLGFRDGKNESRLK